MKTVKLYLMAVAVCLLAGMAITGAIGFVVFTVARVLGLEGASWSAVGWAAILFGASLAGLLALDNLGEDL